MSDEAACSSVEIGLAACRHRLHALAISLTDQVRNIARARAPARLAVKPRKDWLQPSPQFLTAPRLMARHGRLVSWRLPMNRRNADRKLEKSPASTLSAKGLIGLVEADLFVGMYAIGGYNIDGTVSTKGYSTLASCQCMARTRVSPGDRPAWRLPGRNSAALR